MGRRPDQCVVVEDSTAGLRAAEAAGMPAVGYAGSVVPRAELEPLAAVVIDDMRDLPDAVRSL